jgi:hypothetical protein
VLLSNFGSSDDGGHNAAVVLALHVADGPQPLGEPVRIVVEIRNANASDVWMVGVLDGSEEGVRYPHYRPSVTLEGVVLAAPPRPEDPLVAPLRVADFRRLDPGEAFDPTRSEEGAAYLPLSTFATFRPPQPAIYRYALTLSTESDHPDEWLGRFGQDEARADVLDLVAHVPRVTVVSSIDVEVR